MLSFLAPPYIRLKCYSMALKNILSFRDAHGYYELASVTNRLVDKVMPIYWPSGMIHSYNHKLENRSIKVFMVSATAQEHVNFGKCYMARGFLQNY